MQLCDFKNLSKRFLNEFNDNEIRLFKVLVTLRVKLYLRKSYRKSTLIIQRDRRCRSMNYCSAACRVSWSKQRSAWYMAYAWTMCVLMDCMQSNVVRKNHRFDTCILCGAFTSSSRTVQTASASLCCGASGAPTTYVAILRRAQLLAVPAVASSSSTIMQHTPRPPERRSCSALIKLVWINVDGEKETCDAL